MSEGLTHLEQLNFGQVGFVALVVLLQLRKVFSVRDQRVLLPNLSLDGLFLKNTEGAAE